MPTFRLVTASAKYGSRKIKSKRRNGGTQALREEAAKSGAGTPAWTERLPVRFEWWPRHESGANLSGLDLGTFGRRLALGGCRVARLAGIEDWDECVYGGNQAN